LEETQQESQDEDAVFDSGSVVIGVELFAVIFYQEEGQLANTIYKNAY